MRTAIVFIIAVSFANAVVTIAMGALLADVRVRWWRKADVTYEIFAHFIHFFALEYYRHFKSFENDPRR